MDDKLDYFIYGFGLLAVILTAISSYLEKKNSNDKYKKYVTKFTMYAAILGSIVLVAQWRKDYLEDIQNINLLNSNKDFFRKSTSLQNQLKTKSDTISEYQKHLQDSTSILLQQQNITLQKLDRSITAQNSLVEAQRATIKQILGEGFPTIYFYQRDKTFYDASIINSNTQYSLFDCDVTIYDFKKLDIKNFREEKNILFYSRDSLKKYSTQIRGFDVSPNTLLAISYNVKNEDLPKYYYFKIITRNSIVHQYSILNFWRGQMIHSFKIFKQKDKHWQLIKYQDSLFIKPHAWKDFFPYKKSIQNEYY